MRRPFFPLTGVFLTLLGLVSQADGAPETVALKNYAVVVSRATYGQQDWKLVVEALVGKDGAKVIVYDKEVVESLADLQRQFPRYTCFVARPAEATRQFVAQVHRLTRRLDDDPYTGSSSRSSAGPC